MCEDLVLLCFHRHTHFIEFLPHCKPPVTLFDLEPPRPDELRSVLQGSRSDQNRSQIRAVRKVDLSVSLSDLIQMLSVHPVSLQAVCFQAFYCHISAGKIQRLEESRVGIVSFHSCLLRPVFLPAPDPDRKVVFPFRSHAELFLRLQRHPDIGSALHRRDQADPAVAVEKGQREQKSADELAADIAGDLVLSCLESARDRELIALFDECKALFPAYIFVDCQRSCEQRPAPAQHVHLPAHETQRDHEAERAAALSAVEGRRGVSGTSFRDAARNFG